MPTILSRPLATPRWSPLPARGESFSLSSSRKAWIFPTVVLMVALVLSGCLYLHFLDCHRFLWVNPTHDRNAHYLYSLKLATDVRNGHVLQLLIDLNESRVWPPLHGMMAATVLLVGGLDYRLAVLPSLAGWLVTTLFAFLVARRSVPRGGTLAGLIAALFLAASPAHRAFATDIMLESLGAGLTLVTLYAYLLTVQSREEETWKGRFLGLALSLLFLEKYNYWLLLVLALAAAQFVGRPRACLRGAGDALRRIDGWAWASAQFRHPLTYGIAAVLLLIGYVAWRGDQPLIWGRQRISLYPPHNLIHIAYVLLFLRLAAWWWKTGQSQVRQLDGRLRQVVLWHVCPLAVWFLLPKHLSYFLWYLSLGNADPQQHVDLLRGVRQYGTWLVEDYHLDLKSALLCGSLCMAGVLSWRRMRAGGHAVFLLAVIALVLAVMHPNQKSRNLHSWMAAAWIAAGAGAATLIYDGRWRRLTPWLAGAAVVVVGWMQYPGLLAAGRAPEGGLHPGLPSMLDATDAYLGDLDNARRALLLSAVPLKPMMQWTYLERHGSFDRLEAHWYGFGAPGEDNRRGFTEWLKTTDCDTLIYCEKIAARDWPDAGPECRLHDELKDIMRTQKVFQLVKKRDVPHYACRVQVWRR